MATSDGESCSAEDRALTAWENQPWGDGPGPEQALELANARWFDRVSDAFRAGFRAGQEAGPQLGVELARIRDRLNALELWHQQSEAAGQPFPLGTKYEHLAQRVAELEQHPERLGSSEKHIDRRVEQVGTHSGENRRRIEALEEWRQFSAKHLDAIEAKLRLLEPIG